MYTTANKEKNIGLTNRLQVIYILELSGFERAVIYKLKVEKIMDNFITKQDTIKSIKLKL